MAYGLLECPMCGKKFICSDVGTWVYKIGYMKKKSAQFSSTVFCSYTCYRKAQSENPRANYNRVK